MEKCPTRRGVYWNWKCFHTYLHIRGCNGRVVGVEETFRPSDDILWMRVRTGCQDRFLSTLYVPLIFYLNTHWGDFNSSSNSCFLRDTTFAFSFMSCQTLYNIIWQALIYIAFTFNTTEFWPSHPVGPPLIDFFQECASPFHEVSVILKVAFSEVRTELQLEVKSPCSWTDHSGRQSCKYPCTPPRCPPFWLFLMFSTFLW